VSLAAAKLLEDYGTLVTESREGPKVLSLK